MNYFIHVSFSYSISFLILKLRDWNWNLIFTCVAKGMLSRFVSKSISFTCKSDYAAALSTASFCTERILKLNDLTYIKEAFKKVGMII